MNRESLSVHCLFENEKWSTDEIDVSTTYIALAETMRQRQMRITIYCVALLLDIVKRK